MNRRFRWLLAAGGLLLMAVPGSAGEPKHGGIWKIYHRDSPASASIHEEATFSTVMPFMPVMNNLVLYKQDVPQNSLDSIVPDLATSWSWSPDRTELTFKLRDGVKWHDGKPFTSNDVNELPPQAAAAGAAGAARFGLFADLSLPRLAGRHAHAPDRHRPIQVRRVQAQ